MTVDSIRNFAKVTVSSEKGENFQILGVQKIEAVFALLKFIL